jgi:hypothetical protein
MNHFVIQPTSLRRRFVFNAMLGVIICLQCGLWPGVAKSADPWSGSEPGSFIQSSSNASRNAGTEQSTWQQLNQESHSLGQSEWQTPDASSSTGQSQWQTPGASSSTGQSQWQTPGASSSTGQSQWQTPGASSSTGQSQWQAPVHTSAASVKPLRQAPAHSAPFINRSDLQSDWSTPGLVGTNSPLEGKVNKEGTPTLGDVLSDETNQQRDTADSASLSLDKAGEINNSKGPIGMPSTGNTAATPDLSALGASVGLTPAQMLQLGAGAASLMQSIAPNGSQGYGNMPRFGAAQRRVCTKQNPLKQTVHTLENTTNRAVNQAVNRAVNQTVNQTLWQGLNSIRF